MAITTKFDSEWRELAVNILHEFNTFYRKPGRLHRLFIHNGLARTGIAGATLAVVWHQGKHLRCLVVHETNMARCSINSKAVRYAAEFTLTSEARITHYRLAPATEEQVHRHNLAWKGTAYAYQV